MGEIIDLSLNNNIIKKSGAWFSYGETRIGQGRDNVRNFLKDNQDIADEIEGKLRTVLDLPPLNPNKSTKDEKRENS